MKRLFIALALPDATAHALRHAQHDLASLLAADASPRWSTRDNLHLTLKFLGQVPDARLASVCDALAGIAAKSHVLHVELFGLGAFGGAQPRSLYADVGEGKADVLVLMAAVDRAMSALGFVPEQASRVPHVTLARLRKDASAGILGPWLTRQKPMAYGPLDGSAIVLFDSVSDKDGVRYMPLSRWPLGSAVG